jgi:hypothetical protein
VFFASGCLGQNTPPPSGQSDHTTVISTGSDNSVFWVVIVLLIGGCFVMMRNWGKQETRAEVAQLEARLLAAQQNLVDQRPVLERRPVLLNGYPVGYQHEYRQIGR